MNDLRLIFFNVTSRFSIWLGEHLISLGEWLKARALR